MVSWLQSTDICVVTGGGKGLGAAIINELSNYGCQTVSLDVDFEDEEQEQGPIENQPQNGGPAKQQPVNVGAPSGAPSGQCDDPNCYQLHEQPVDGSTDSQEAHSPGQQSESSESSEAASEVHKEQRKTTIKVHPTMRIKCDVTKQEDVDNARRIILAKFQRPPSVVILNAGIRGPVKQIVDAEVGELEKTFSVNLGGVVRSAKAFLPEMIQQKRGFIITVSSALGMITPVGFSAYGASKAGVIAFHEGLEREVKHQGIKCLLVCPGQLDTAMFSDVETPSKSLAPVMGPGDLAAKIVKRVKKGKTRAIYAPLYVRYLTMLRAAPSPFSKVARKVSRIDNVYEKQVLEAKSKPASVIEA